MKEDDMSADCCAPIVSENGIANGQDQHDQRCEPHQAQPQAQATIDMLEKKIGTVHSDTNFTAEAIISSRTMCEICGTNAAKYCCPRCSLRSCSLSCVRQHKARDSCSGLRDKTGYVKIKSFTDINLLSDYRFLEDAGRKASNAQRDHLKRKHKQPHFLENLRYQTKRRGIHWSSMPYPATKRVANKTFYHYRTRVILWHVEWLFLASEAKYTNKVKETILLKDAVNGFIHPTESDPVIRQRLKIYVQSGLENIKLLLKADRQPANDARYYELDMNKTLADNLIGKCFIEYPSIHVVLADKAQNYTLITPPPPAVSCGSKTEGSTEETGESENVKSHNAEDSTPTEETSHSPEMQDTSNTTLNNTDKIDIA